MSTPIKVKSGWQTTELWLTMLATVLMVVWPDFPKEAFLGIATWAAGRSAQKMFGFVDPTTGKAAWQTSEFWVTIVYAVVTSVFPDMPPASLFAVQGWIATRTGIKVRAERAEVKAIEHVADNK